MKFEFSDISENTCIKINDNHPVGAKLVHVDGQTDSQKYRRTWWSQLLFAIVRTCLKIICWWCISRKA